MRRQWPAFLLAFARIQAATTHVCLLFARARRVGIWSHRTRRLLVGLSLSTFLALALLRRLLRLRLRLLWRRRLWQYSRWWRWRQPALCRLLLLCDESRRHDGDERELLRRGLIAPSGLQTHTTRRLLLLLWRMLLRRLLRLLNASRLHRRRR